MLHPAAQLNALSASPSDFCSQPRSMRLSDSRPNGLPTLEPAPLQRSEPFVLAGKYSGPQHQSLVVGHSQTDLDTTTPRPICYRVRDLLTLIVLFDPDSNPIGQCSCWTMLLAFNNEKE